ncbi:MAG: hypothetical protein K0Q57_915 [Gammaproteobacteria bacterium]|jgi:hypothetical protein|nr:hypothetical protein [Gammaproteobacteria bacterium]
MAFARRFSLSDAVPGDAIKTVNVGDGYDRGEAGAAAPIKSPVFSGEYIATKAESAMNVKFTSLTTASEVKLTQTVAGEVPAVAEAVKIGFKSAYEKTSRHTSNTFCCAMVKTILTSRQWVKADATFNADVVALLKSKPAEFKTRHGTHYLAEQDTGAALIVYINAKTAKDVTSSKLSGDLNASVPGTDFKAAISALHEKVKSKEILEIECRITARGVVFPTEGLVYRISQADSDDKWAGLAELITKTVASFDKAVEKAKAASAEFYKFEGRFRDYWNLAVVAKPEYAAIRDKIAQHVSFSLEIESLIDNLTNIFTNCPSTEPHIDNLRASQKDLRKLRHTLETAWSGDPTSILATYEAKVATILANFDSLLAYLLGLRLIHSAFPVYLSTIKDGHTFTISHSYRTGIKASTFVGYSLDRAPISNVYLVPVDNGHNFVSEGSQVQLRITNSKGEECAVMPTFTVDVDKPFWPTVVDVETEGASWTVQHQNAGRVAFPLQEADSIILTHIGTKKQLGDSKRDGKLHESGEYTLGCQGLKRATERDHIVYQVGVHPVNNFTKRLVLPIVSELARAINSFAQTLASRAATITPTVNSILASYHHPAPAVAFAPARAAGGAGYSREAGVRAPEHL